MDAAEVAGLAEALLQNPFETGADRGAAEAAVAEACERPLAVLEELLRRGLHKEARRLAVAMAYRDWSSRGDSRLLDVRAVPERIFDQLTLPRRAVRDSAAAAVSCSAAIACLAGTSPAMRRLRAATWRACFGDSLYEAIRLRPVIREQNILVLGETGTGKELVAQAIAAADPQPGRTQMLNAAAIPRDMLEAELFGHAKGAFTGASAEREGKIVAAAGGTIFLDEIADLPLELQAKLLRVVEDDRVTPLGSNQSRGVDVRYVCATSQPLAANVERGEFRRDLYERLAGTTLVIPPLRERLEDLKPIADSLFQRYQRRLGGDSAEVGASVTHLAKLTVVQARFRAWLDGAEARSRSWSGNVRELQSLMRSWILGFEEGGRPAEGPAGKRPDQASPASSTLAQLVDAQATLREIEDWYILHVMGTVQYHQRRAASILGIDRGTLLRRLRQLDAVQERE